MKQLSALEKRSLNKPLIDPPTVTRMKMLLRTWLLKLGRIKIKYKIVSETECNPIFGKPIIYSTNHSEYSDALITSTSISRYCRFLAGKQPLDTLGSLFFWVHGTIFFDRLNKAEMTAVKEEICACLNQGIDLIWAPEGAWNLSDSLPILPMRWGIIDVARITNAQIIPFVMNYDRENMTCRVDWGEPIHGDMLNDKQAAINRLRDCMASFCWEAWARKPLIRRADVDVKALRAAIDAPKLEYSLLDYDEEEAVVFKPATSPTDAFDHLSAVVPRLETAFLFDKRLSGLRST